MSSLPPKPPNSDSLGQLSPEQEQQVQRWQRMAASRSSSRGGDSLAVSGLGLGDLGEFIACGRRRLCAAESSSLCGGKFRGTARSRPGLGMGVVIVVSCVGGSLLLGRWLEIRGRR